MLSTSFPAIRGNIIYRQARELISKVIKFERTHPIFGVPSTSLSLSGPAKFLARVVGMIGRGAIGRAWNFESGTIAPPGKNQQSIYYLLWKKLCIEEIGPICTHCPT